MKRKTNAELIDLLNKCTTECNQNLNRALNAENRTDNLHAQLACAKQMNQQLIDALHAGAKEGSWPRRQS